MIMYVADLYDVINLMIDMLNGIIVGLKMAMIPHTSVSVFQVIILGILFRIALKFLPIYYDAGNKVAQGGFNRVNRHINNYKKTIENRKIAKGVK